MATQHPDNASAPWWKEGAFVSTTDEIDELLLLFTELPIDEYMWDWEGKYVDEAVGEKIFSRAGDFFARSPLGDANHLTYRIPAFADGKMHRLARAFMNVLTLSDLGRELKLPRPPVTEMFLPMVTSHLQPLQVHKAFRETTEYHRAVFHQTKEDESVILDSFRVTPLVEDVDSLFAIEGIVRPYWEMLRKEKRLGTRGQRIFLARSDPALNAGLVPAVLAAKAALSITAAVGEEIGFPVHPVLGTGSLPFRGSVHPRNVQGFMEQYAGTRTYSIQSAFRYDYPLDEVRSALGAMRTQVPGLDAVRIPDADLTALRETAAEFTAAWKPAIESLAPVINRVSGFVPKRRERLQHIGLFGYSRGIGAVRLPRAIGFTAALYSLGVPPELIATGRGLRAAKEAGRLDLLEKYYPMLRDDLRAAGAYLNRENVILLARQEEAFKGVMEDVTLIQEILDVPLESPDPAHVIHRNLTSNIFHRLQQAEPDAERLVHDITEAAVLRRSMG